MCYQNKVAKSIETANDFPFIHRDVQKVCALKTGLGINIWIPDEYLVDLYYSNHPIKTRGAQVHLDELKSSLLNAYSAHSSWNLKISKWGIQL